MPTLSLKIADLTNMFAILLSLFVTNCYAQDSSTKKFSKEETQRLYQDFLKAYGDESSLSSQGHVQFKVGPFDHVLLVQEDAQDLLNMLLIVPMELNDENRAIFLEFANRVNKKAKCAKILLLDDQVWISAETYIESPDKAKPMIKKLKASLFTAFKTLSAEMDRLKKQIQSREK